MLYCVCYTGIGVTRCSPPTIARGLSTAPGALCFHGFPTGYQQAFHNWIDADVRINPARLDAQASPRGAGAGDRFERATGTGTRRAANRQAHGHHGKRTGTASPDKPTALTRRGAEADAGADTAWAMERALDHKNGDTTASRPFGPGGRGAVI